MRHSFPTLLIAIHFMSACQNNSGAEKNVSTPPVQTGPTTTCYAQRQGADLTAIELTLNGDLVTGYYAWEPDQKDGSHGVLKGKKTGDMIEATYDYMIEGTIQSEEVVFKMEGDTLVQGRGEFTDPTSAVKMVLKDKKALTWDEKYPLVDCATIKTAIDLAKEIQQSISK